jgi:hypothetical protein
MEMLLKNATELGIEVEDGIHEDVLEFVLNDFDPNDPTISIGTGFIVHQSSVDGIAADMDRRCLQHMQGEAHRVNNSTI